MKFETYNFDQIDKNIYFLVLNSPKIYYFSKVNLLKFVSMSLLIRSDQFYFKKLISSCIFNKKISFDIKWNIRWCFIAWIKQYIEHLNVYNIRYLLPNNRNDTYHQNNVYFPLLLLFINRMLINGVKSLQIGLQDYPRRGTLIFSANVGSDPASTVQPKKISGISSTPKKYLKF